MELPCGTPLCIGNVGPLWFGSEIRAVLLLRNVNSVFANMGGRPVLLILYFKPLCQTLSNAFDTSLSTRQHCSLFPNECAIFSEVRAKAVSVPLFVRKPCCVVGSKLLYSRYVLSLLFIIFSKILPGTSSNDMGL